MSTVRSWITGEVLLEYEGDLIAALEKAAREDEATMTLTNRQQGGMALCDRIIAVIDALPHAADCGGEYLEWAARLSAKIASGYEPLDCELRQLARVLNDWNSHYITHEVER